MNFFQLTMTTKSSFARANVAFRNKNYESAIALYDEAISQAEDPLIRTHIRFNRELALKRAGRAPLIQKDPNSAAAVLEKPNELDAYYFSLIQQGSFFDTAWYLGQYKDKHNVSGNPLAHYLAHGVALSTNPSPQFDTAFYIKTYQDVAKSGMHPFLHYVCEGHKENRQTKPPPSEIDLNIYPVEAPQYVPRLSLDAPPVEKAVRIIAFYLPQFHAIPENDEWWGKGFTEWTNVRPAQPQFEGHYQPHVPDEFIGYYNLLNRDTQAKQIELAKQYGVEGFCFYLYWFTGHRLLEQPVDNYLNDPSLDLPFCVCWANENWSRRWDGRDTDLLMEQHYSDEDDLAFIADVAKYLRDQCYIRINGKPLLLVYRPNLFPNMRATSDRWRHWCRNNNVGEIYLAYPQSFESVDPANYGFDAAIEFPPNNSSPPDITTKVTPTVNDFETIVYDWRVFIDRSKTYKEAGYTLFRAVTPSWDNTARKKTKGTVFLNNSPKLFEKWLSNAIENTLSCHENPDEQIVFINAWNEWAEGAHLEPDQLYGYAWLQAVRQAQMAMSNKRQRILIVSHDAHPHGAQLLSLNMAKHFKSHLGFEVEMILLGEGNLLPRFAEYATVHRIDMATSNSAVLDATLSNLRRKGVRTAIVNTTVSGQLVPHLKRHDFTVVSLVHELPGILASYNLQQHAQAIADHADKIVFAALQVKQGFEAFIGQSLQQAVIRPQGLYQRSWLRAGADKKVVCQQVRQQLGIPAEAKIILCTGYADQRKGFDLFVQICAQVMQHRLNVYALWVGHTDKGFVDASMAHADGLGLRSRFLFTGLVDEPQPYYLAADIYALTSREDPFPSVVMEAFDALTPVVAFKACGGFEELLKRGCGELAAKGDVDSFAGAILNLLDDPQRSSQMAQMGREIVERELNFRHYLFDLLEIGNQITPRVSVVVPNYNYARYLQDRLETVTAQTLPLYELIVLDDRSPDDSLHVIKNALTKCEVPWRLEVNETNSGSVFKQWRKGVELARGEYIWIAEADDTCKPQFLDRVVSRMHEAGAVMGFSDSWQIDEEGNYLGDSYKPYANEEAPGAFDQSFVMEGHEFLANYLGVKNVILNVSGAVFRREALLTAIDKLGDELFGYKVAGDWRLYIELCASNGKVLYEAEPLNGHRRHQKSVTHALAAERHLQEIEKLQILSNKTLSISQSKTSQMIYLEKVKRYLNEKGIKVKR
jgi:lipopolysaccharide biosynthesis protein/glycosyltransferase involved in cell wall biosynthesis